VLAVWGAEVEEAAVVPVLTGVVGGRLPTRIWFGSIV
jgi:hypothetical protein